MQREYHKPRVGISSCLLGERVRYDGGHKRDEWLAGVLGGEVEWVPVCPEVEAGFGTPREPMDLVRRPDGAIAAVTHAGRDVTAVLQRFSDRRVEELAAERLSGYVLKSGSPSCGLGNAPAGTAETAENGRMSGLFARALLARLPDLPIEDERRLADSERRRAFVARVFAYHRTQMARAASAEREPR